MIGQTSALDVSATNIANASTPGFRADRALFRQTLATATNRSTATQSLRYSVMRTVEPDLKGGEINQTGRPLDIAFRDEQGLFAVQTRDGIRYTRAGNFQLTAAGELTTAEGLPVLGENKTPITVPADQTISFDQTGQVLADGQPTGSKLLVVSFPRPQALEKQGSTLLRGTVNSGTAAPHESELAPGYLELSNSSAVEGMTKLVSATREFEMLARVVEAFSNVEHRAATSIMNTR